MKLHQLKLRSYNCCSNLACLAVIYHNIGTHTYISLYFNQLKLMFFYQNQRKSHFQLIALIDLV